LRAFRWAPGSGELLDIGVERDGPESGGWMSACTAGSRGGGRGGERRAQARRRRGGVSGGG
jgi:hypothetical protein